MNNTVVGVDLAKDVIQVCVDKGNFTERPHYF